MFQTDIIHYLQSYQSGFMTFVMQGVTTTGYPYFFMLLAAVIMFGYSFRKGFFLVQLMLLTGIATEFFKNFFALPRPGDVDSTILLPGRTSPNDAPFTGMGAPGFFNLLPDEVITYYRSLDGYSYGFPSGHVSGSAAFWSYTALAFRKRWLTMIAIVMIVLSPLSRMYLGRHFLADVLGGFAVGGFFLLIAYYAVFRGDIAHTYFKQKPVAFTRNLKSFFLVVYLIIFPVAILLLLPLVKPEYPGVLLGFNLGFLMVLRNGLPKDGGTNVERIARIVMAGVMFMGTSFLLNTAASYIVLRKPWFAEFFAGALSVFIGIWGTTELCIKTGLYSRSMNNGVI